MKKRFKITLSLSIAGLFLAGLLVAGLHSCQEPIPEIALEDFMYITMTGAKNNPNLKKMDLNNSRDTTFNINVSYGGTTNYNHGDIDANIDADLSLVSAYNTANNTYYLPMPAGSYSFSGNTARIENGKNASLPLKLTIKKSNLNLSNEYLLPVTIKSISGGDLKLNEDLKTLYIVILADIDEEVGKDKWTSGGASTVWQAGYEVEKIFDNNTNTYWHSDLNGLPQWFIIDMGGFKRVDGFMVNNRKDLGQDALPKHVIIETSFDKVNWEKVIDIAEMPRSRVMQVLPIGNTVVARYLRFTILSTWNDAPYTYLAELNIYSGPDPESEIDFERHNWTIHGFSSDWGDGWGAINCLNDDLGSTWHTDPFNTALNGMPQWFSVDMQKELKFSGFITHNRTNDPGAAGFPKNVKFEVSNDGTNWTTVLEDELPSEMWGYHRSALASPVTARYFRFTVVTNWTDGDWTYLAYINIY